MKNIMSPFQLQDVCDNKVFGSFDVPQMSSDFGVLLLKEIEEDSHILSNLSNCIKDIRHQSYVTHSISNLISQRVYQICQGYEDADDCDHFRQDSVFQLGVGKSLGNALASQPTMSRFENSITEKDLLRCGESLLESFLHSFSRPPKMIVLDMDPTAVHCHGSQEGIFYNKYEGEYCFMPFHVYDGITGKLITTTIRPGKTPDASEILTILKRVVQGIQNHFPTTRLLFRADSHHSKPEVHEWCDRNSVDFIIGQNQQGILDRQFAFIIEKALRRYNKYGKPVRMYASGRYAAGTWKKHRRIICRVIINEEGKVDTRYIVTSFEVAKARSLYEKVYSDRGNAERYIGEYKNGTGAKKLSCQKGTANQFRLFLHSAAYMILYTLREKLLPKTALAKSEFATIRNRLLKVTTVIEKTKDTIILHLPQYFPYKEVYFSARTLLKSSQMT